MCGISNLNDAGAWRAPSGLWIAPQQLKVDDCLRWRAFDKLLEDRCPFGTRYPAHLVENFLRTDGIVP